MSKPNRKRLASVKKLLDVIDEVLYFEIKKSNNEAISHYLETACREMAQAIDSL